MSETKPMEYIINSLGAHDELNKTMKNYQDSVKMRKSIVANA
jgi:hypothetical protein